MRLIVITLLAFVSFAYDENLGKEYWYYSSASYCSEAKLTAWNCGVPCQKGSRADDVKVYYNNSHASSGFGSYNTARNHIVLTFRGTVPWNIKNWISDLNFFKTKYPHCDNNCQVHTGFYTAYQEIEQQMFDHYNQLRAKHPTAQLVINGHSLGGAIAHHALVHLKKRGINVDHFYTYGSPRVGDDKFSDFFKTFHPSEKNRVTHNYDPVPHLPMASQGFKHSPTEVYYSTYTNYVICNDANDEDPKCSNSHWVDLNIDDHIHYYDLNQLTTTPLCQ